MLQTFAMRCPPLPDFRWVTGRFAEPLDPAGFARLLKALFGDWRRSGLWGNPICLGPAKAHVYGVEMRTWRLFMLELTDRGFLITAFGGDPEEIARAVEEAAPANLRSEIAAESRFEKAERTLERLGRMERRIRPYVREKPPIRTSSFDEWTDR